MNKTYIYGENFVKTKKNLYCIKSYNYYNESKIVFDFYIKVKSYSQQNGKTNSFTSIDGNKHIQNLNNELLFNRISEKSKLFKALKQRINF